MPAIRPSPVTRFWPAIHLHCVAGIATVTLCYARSNPTPHIVAAPTSLTTQERMYASAFLPTKGDLAASEYAGEAVCASCHAGIASLQHQTPMYHAATPASLLSIHSPLKFQESAFSYSVQQTPSGIIFSANSVSASGSHSDSRAVAWAFGNGEA
ncbi:hypothetical protein [Tunturiibacter gelidoferens]|uniref:Uncharacterized protein n=1 Tax=Tunturiibacter gelidiferens TaxID=3069689 RepID=A0A9X0QCR7_9BACT|nr:hypothetical protein [Edaphobacter lichenicola]MBB5327942.1 hypothetical protein [Edaphobacter lichenicola]